MTKPAPNPRFRVGHQRPDDTSRLFAMAFARYFQRVSHLQRSLVDGDLDLSIIATAIAIANVESIMRDAATRHKFADISTVFGDRQRGCNAMSIAEATGLPRETVRRKMRRLVDMGILVRRGVGDYIWQPGVLQSPLYRQTLDELSAEATRFMNECVEQCIFVVETPRQ